MAACLNCGAQNHSNARFCSNCGSAVAALRPERHEARKVVTVVFCDVAGSTALGERLDPEVVRAVMSRYFTEMRTVIERYGGTVEKFIGDAVMAVFGVPTVHEDDALRAVAAADQMNRAREALNAELEADWGVRIQTRTGVNTGEVMAGDPSGGDSFVIGDAVNLAARLEQQAPIDAVLIGDATARLVRGAVELEDAGLMEVRGKTEPVRAWRLDRLIDHSAQRAGPATPFVGRADHLAALREAFERTLASRRCELIAVTGPAGIGKSRLVDEFAISVASRARVVHGRCLPYGTLTYWPLAEVVRDLAEMAPDARPAEMAGAIATLLPEGHDAAAARVVAAIGVGEAHSTVPEETFASIRLILEYAARRQPLIVHFDDVHWAERTFVDLLEYLPRLSRDVPLLIVCTARRDVLEPQPGWATGDLLELEPLADGEIAMLLTAVAGGVAPPDLVAERLHAAASGNPLFAEEMMRMLLEEEVLEHVNGGWRVSRALDDVPIPPTINALLAARLERLPSAEREVLERAAVVGRDFSLPLLAELCDGLDRAAVDKLARAGVIRAYDEAGVTYGFAHLMMRDVAYHALPKALRAELHEQLAARSAVFVGERDEVIGYHLEQAHRYRLELGNNVIATDLGSRAAKYLATAGRRANALGDLSTAVALLGRAEALLAPLAPERLALLPQLGEALCDLGDPTGARDLLTAAVEDTRRAGEERIEMEAELALAYATSFTEAQAGLKRLRNVAQRAIGLFGELHDDAGLARAWQALAIVHVGACQWRDAEQARWHGLEHARAAAEHGLELRALSGLAYALYFGPGAVPDAAHRIEEQILPRTRGVPVAEGAVLGVLGGLLGMQGRFTEARALHARARDIFAQIGPALPAVEGSLTASDTELLAGDAAAAERELRAASAALQAAGETAIRASVAATLAQALYDQGRDDEALPLTEESERLADEDDVQAQATWRAVRALILARQRPSSQVPSRLAREAVALARATDDLNLTATTLVAAGELDEAVALFAAKGNLAAVQRFRRSQTA